MGLLSSITGKIKSVVKDIGAVYKGGNVSASQGKISTGLINAAATIGQSFNPFSPLKPSVNQNVVKSPTLQAAGNFLVKNPYTSAAIVAAPFSSAGKSLAAKAVSTTKAKLLTGAIATAVIPAAVTSSKVRSSIINTASSVTPESIISTSANVGQFIEEPSGKNIKDLLTENKNTLLTGGAIIAALGAAKVAAPLITGALINNDNKPSPSQGVIVNDKSAEILKDIPASPTPITPQTEQIKNSYGGATRKRARKRTTSPLSVSQRVNVIVSSRNQNVGINKRYLNKVAVLN